MKTETLKEQYRIYKELSIGLQGIITDKENEIKILIENNQIAEEIRVKEKLRNIELETKVKTLENHLEALREKIDQLSDDLAKAWILRKDMGLEKKEV